MPRRNRTDGTETIHHHDGNSRLRVITDALPVGLAYVNQDKVYSFANDRFAAAYGLTPAEIIGKHADDFISRDAMVLGDAFFDAAHSGSPSDFTHPARHADGRAMTVRTFLRPDVSEDGTVLGFYVCSINVTAQKEAEAIRLQTQKMDAVGQLASGIAHDFNNLLGIILGNLAELRDTVSAESDHLALVDPAIRAAEHGARLTGQLLALARRQPLKPQAVDIEACIEACLQLLRRTLPPDITLTFIRAAKARPVFLDPAQFETALLNLCLNARDAMPDGGDIRLAVSFPNADRLNDVGPSDGRDVVQVVVSDTGTGMDAETAAQAFQPFFTTKLPGHGTGLGLSMVYGFVRQSHGSIDLKSEPGAGTIITLTLPLATAAQSAAVAPRTSFSGHGLVLLVDDNEDFRRTIRRQLIRAGYTVMEAGDSHEALELLTSIAGFRALVSDIAMPGLDGRRLAAEATARHRDLRVVLMTGLDRCGNLSPGDPTVPVLQKPFDGPALVRAIEQPRTFGRVHDASALVHPSIREADAH